MTYGILASDWVNQARDLLLNQHREEITLLAGALTDTTTTALTTADVLAAIKPGALLEIDSEMMYVRASLVGTVTVIRGWNGTTAATHVDQSVITVNPRFPRSRILRALNDTLSDLGGSDYFQMKTVNLTYNPNVFTYDLASDAIEVYDITFPLSPTNTTMWQQRVHGFDLQQNADPSVFPSGVALQFSEPPGVQQGQTVRVRYKAPFTYVANLTDDVSITGLPKSGCDIPPIGAAIRLMMGREVKRNFTESQPETRRTGEVPAGAVLGSMRGLQAEYVIRQLSESAALKQIYPDRRRQYGFARSRTWLGSRWDR